MLFSLHRLSSEFYGENSIADLPNLRRLYARFKERSKARLPDGAYTEELKTLANHCKGDSETWLGGWKEDLKVAGVYLEVW